MPTDRQLLSIVMPVYNEERSLVELFPRLRDVVKSLQERVEVEVIMVDDHSHDSTPTMLARLCAESTHIEFIRLSRNCGSHVAIIAGLSRCKGNCAVFLASDLQDPPELILELYEKYEQGFDVVWAIRESVVGITATTSFFSRLFYRIMNSISTVNLPPTGADFALISRQVIAAVIQSAGSNPSLGGLIAWVGFRQGEIYYTKQLRKFGKSKWTVTKKLNAFADALVGFSYAPMRMMTYAGFISSAGGFVYASIIVVLKLTVGKQIDGWASLMVVVLVISGLQMLMLGVLGEYLWRSLEESRKRPLFFTERASGRDDKRL